MHRPTKARYLVGVVNAEAVQLLVRPRRDAMSQERWFDGISCLTLHASHQAQLPRLVRLYQLVREAVKISFALDLLYLVP